MKTIPQKSLISVRAVGKGTENDQLHVVGFIDDVLKNLTSSYNMMIDLLDLNEPENEISHIRQFVPFDMHIITRGLKIVMMEIPEIKDTSNNTNDTNGTEDKEKSTPQPSQTSSQDRDNNIEDRSEKSHPTSSKSTTVQQPSSFSSTIASPVPKPSSKAAQDLLKQCSRPLKMTFTPSPMNRNSTSMGVTNDDDDDMFYDYKQSQSSNGGTQGKQNGNNTVSTKTSEGLRKNPKDNKDVKSSTMDRKNVTMMKKK